ncbi:hypothetical protein Syun_027374 [Stephania yunnanensis]|uniref:Uncharacterized protein n=1 Tax=Stephania yunnanensis TaxID=152371 RepID=A0AAP0EKZ3_9MAGN
MMKMLGKKASEELNERWLPTIFKFSGSSSSDGENKDGEITMINSCKSPSMAAPSKKKRSKKTRKQVDNLNAIQVNIPNSTSGSNSSDGEAMIINGCTSPSMAAPPSKKKRSRKTRKRVDNLNAKQVNNIPSSSSDGENKDGEITMINGCKSPSMAAPSKKKRSKKTRKQVDNLNARKVNIPSSSSDSNNDDYDFLKTEVARVLKTFARNLSSKSKKDNNSGKEDEKAKKRNKKGGKEKKLKRGNSSKPRWVLSSYSCSCSSSGDSCGMTTSEGSVSSSDYDWEKHVGGSYLNSPSPSSLPVPGKTASLMLLSPPPSSLPLPWFMLPVGLLS